MKKKVYIDDFSWFDVVLDDDGEPTQVIESRVVWSPGRGSVSTVMSERVRRAIEQAKTQS